MNSWELNNESNGRIENYNFSVITPYNAGNKALNIQGYDYISHYYGNSYNDMQIRMERPLYHLENIGVNIMFEDGILKKYKDKQSVNFDMNAYIKRAGYKAWYKPKKANPKRFNPRKRK